MAIRSPFPGIDPYLERYWEGVQARLVGYIADALAPQLPDDLAARIEERVYIDGGGYPVSVRRPDVRVVEDPVSWAVGRSSSRATAVAEPIVLQLEREPVTERSVRIMDVDGNRIVTAIEVLSPWNKHPGAGRKAYLRKRDEVFASEANLVEIDLVREGDWLSLLSPYHIPRPYHTIYRISVWRAARPGHADLYPITLQQALPSFRVPLRAEEADAILAMQPLIDSVYQNGRYDRTDYTVDCEPPLQGEDAAWAQKLLKTAGKS